MRKNDHFAASITSSKTPEDIVESISISHFKVDILQVHDRLLTTLLLIRCDYAIILTFLDDRKRGAGANSPSVQVDWSINGKDCEKLIAESHSRTQAGNTVEGHLYWARFLALELGPHSTCHGT